ncbi:MAG: NAD(P)/FAD-dependent oxidoreductase [Dehalococcoidia bacterium]
MYDVVVVGAGPGGSIAAMKCVQHGLNTLLLERKALPRDKVCTGMIMGPIAHSLIAQEFGDIPPQVLTTPPSLDGVKLYVPGVEPATIALPIPIGWRKDLDYWMAQKAMEAGVEVRDSTRLAGIFEEPRGYTLEVVSRATSEQIETAFVIGADGGNSTTRKALFPEFEVKYLQALRECYRAEMPPGLEGGYIYFVVPPKYMPLYWCIHRKGDVLLLELAGRMGEAKAMMDDARIFLAQEHGLDLAGKLQWKDGCLEPLMHRDLLTGTFLPAKGNALLVGDAAGLAMPVTGEGIGTAMQSAVVAAASVAAAIKENRKAEEFFHKGMRGLLEGLKDIYDSVRNIRQEAAKGPEYLCQALDQSWRKALELK